MTALGTCSASRSTAAWPRWEEPLSTIGEHPVGGFVGLLGHDLGDEVGERDDAGGVLAAAEHLRAVDVVGGEVGHRTAAVVVVVDPNRSGLAGGQCGVAAAAGLDGGLLVGRDHEILLAQ